MAVDTLFLEATLKLYVAFRADAKPTTHDEDFARAVKDADEFVQRWQDRKK